ncbi:MAG TPA: AAA family ATPase, partial [Pyrinomonadaceae bacterium]|nr:AAA family ATPase [Pyrinomonadaceae bacterium]
MAYYSGNPQNRRAPGELRLPGSRRAKQTDPAGYKPDQGLIDAVNVALMLGQPLLLTGEPGTGKTQLANSVAWELGFDPPLMFETKSTNTA